MYVYALRGLGQTLEDPPPPCPTTNIILSQVCQRPQDFKPLLWTVIIHPRPKKSAVWQRQQFTVDKHRGTHSLLDVIIIWVLNESEIENGLKQIAMDFARRDPPFKKQLRAELALKEEIKRTLPLELRRRLKSDRENLKRSLLDLLFLPDRTDFPERARARLAGAFAKAALPRLSDRIEKSAAKEGQLTVMGDSLIMYASELEKDDRDFKRQVEERRKEEKLRKKWEKQEELREKHEQAHNRKRGL